MEYNKHKITTSRMRSYCLIIVFLTVLYNSCATGAASISDNIHRQKRDNYGCDAFVTSCGSKGACCDVHDQCYKEHGCTWTSWFYTGKL